MLACWKMKPPIFALLSNDPLQTRGRPLQEGLAARLEPAWSAGRWGRGQDPSDPMSCSHLKLKLLSGKGSSLVFLACLQNCVPEPSP